MCNNKLLILGGCGEKEENKLAQGVEETRKSPSKNNQNTNNGNSTTKDNTTTSSTKPSSQGNSSGQQNQTSTVNRNKTYYQGLTETQCQELDKKVADIIAKNITSGMSRYEKVKAIHDYIVKNTYYDWSLTKHSAYIL